MNTKIKLIVLPIIIGIIMLVLPNCVNAKTVELSGKTAVYGYYVSPSEQTKTTIDNLINGETLRLSGTHVFRNEFIFCFEANQDLKGRV